MFDGVFRGKPAWRRATIRERDYRLKLTDGCLGELNNFVATLRRNPLQTELLSPADHDLHKTHRLLARAKRILDEGVGFVVLDRLPAQSFDKSEMKAVYWILSSMIARPVAQSYGGTMLYDVRDTGKKKSPKVRADLTNQELDFHTDYSYNTPPPYLGLQVLRTAKRGGRSGMVSLYTAHNELRRRHPDLLHRLYQPFWINRYGEHAPGLPKAGRHPVFAYDGSRVRGRFNPRNIIAGHDLMGEALDEKGRAAIEALTDVMEDSEMHLNFHLKVGETVYIANDHCAHLRTAYKDHDDPDRWRHLIRIFLRDEGLRSYDG